MSDRFKKAFVEAGGMPEPQIKAGAGMMDGIYNTSGIGSDWQRIAANLQRGRPSDNIETRIGFLPNFLTGLKNDLRENLFGDASPNPKWRKMKRSLK